MLEFDVHPLGFKEIFEDILDQWDRSDESENPREGHIVHKIPVMKQKEFESSSYPYDMAILYLHLQRGDQFDPFALSPFQTKDFVEDDLEGLDRLRAYGERNGCTLHHEANIPGDDYIDKIRKLIDKGIIPIIYVKSMNSSFTPILLMGYFNGINDRDYERTRFIMVGYDAEYPKLVGDYLLRNREDRDVSVKYRIVWFQNKPEFVQVCDAKDENAAEKESIALYYQNLDAYASKKPISFGYSKTTIQYIQATNKHLQAHNNVSDCEHDISAHSGNSVETPGLHSDGSHSSEGELPGSLPKDVLLQLAASDLVAAESGPTTTDIPPVSLGRPVGINNMFSRPTDRLSDITDSSPAFITSRNTKPAEAVTSTKKKKGDVKGCVIF